MARNKPKQKPLHTSHTIGIDEELLDALGVKTVAEAESLAVDKSSAPPSNASPSIVSLYETNPVLRNEDLALLRKHFQGVKARIFRYLFTKQYSILDIHKACEATLYPGLRYQQVYNAYKNHTRKLAKEQALSMDPYDSTPLQTNTLSSRNVFDAE